MAVYKWKIVVNSKQVLDLKRGGLGLLKTRIPKLISRVLIQ
jgi:hypothetical protein